VIANSSVELGSFQANEKPVILIVDDSRVMRVSLKKALSKEYTVIEAADGEEGWEKLQEDSAIQVVFSDLSMPKLDGLGFLERIRQSDRQRIRDIPFIVITGNDDSGGMHQKVLSLGATDLIGKPFKSMEIRAQAQAHVVHQRKLSDVVPNLEEQATVDSVTGLANQRYFTERAAQDLSFSVRHKNEIALLRLHVDQLSGKTAPADGVAVEKILIATAETLKNHTRCEDIIAHYGNGKFVVLLPATNADGAKQLANRIRQDLTEQRLKTSLTASIGVAVCDAQQKNITLDDLMSTAEQRLAAAIDQGGNCVVDMDIPVVSVVDEQSIEASRVLSVELEAMGDRVAQLTRKLAELDAAKSMAIEANKTLQSEMDNLLQQVQTAEQAQQTAQVEAQQGLADQQAYEQLQQENSRLQTTLDEADKRVEVADANLQKTSQALADYDAGLEQIKAKFEQQSTTAEQAQSQAETALEQIKAQHQQELAEAVASASTPAPSRAWLFVLMLIVGAAAGGGAGLYFSGTLF